MITGNFYYDAYIIVGVVIFLVDIIYTYIYKKQSLVFVFASVVLAVCWILTIPFLIFLVIYNFLNDKDKK